MATRQERLAEFESGVEPKSDIPMQILCEDHVGTYTPPFLALFRDGRWLNARTMEALETIVIGWRTPRGVGRTG